MANHSIVELAQLTANYTDSGDSAQEALTRASVGWTGKNKLPIKIDELKANNTIGTWSGNTYVLSGITFTITVDNRGYVTEINGNGTASANITNFFLILHFTLKAGSYMCTGNPAGITGTTYGLRISDVNFNPINLFFEQGNVLTLNNDASELKVDIRIPEGQVLDNVPFYPMICDARIKDSTFEPYHESVLDYAFPAEAQGVLGAKNLFPTRIESKQTTGGTITNNANYTYTISGNFTADSFIEFDFDFPPGSYILSGCDNGSSDTYFLDIYESKWTNRQVCYDGDKEISFTGGTNHVARVFVKSGANITTPVTIKPMIRLVSDSDNTFAPPAMTNRELTEGFNNLPNMSYFTYSRAYGGSAGTKRFNFTCKTDYQLFFVFASPAWNKMQICSVIPQTHMNMVAITNLSTDTDVLSNAVYTDVTHFSVDGVAWTKITVFSSDEFSVTVQNDV